MRQVLRAIKPLHAAADDRVFLNARGGPIDQRERPRDGWHAALRACEIRPRKFHATRHTFISASLTAGLNVKFIAEYTGTFLAMIEQHYGRFLEAEASAQLRMLDAADGAKTSTSDQGLAINAYKFASQKTSPTGFVPYYSRPFTWLRS